MELAVFLVGASTTRVDNIKILNKKKTQDVKQNHLPLAD